ncbi:hypothetical protein, partial [Bacteroides fluxus]|uniref:hypothetical protein n=1 Tax=Bacteroides fluxus TaxID=626930 RepID=UPI001C1269DA
FGQEEELISLYRARCPQTSLYRKLVTFKQIKVFEYMGKLIFLAMTTIDGCISNLAGIKEWGIEAGCVWNNRTL